MPMYFFGQETQTWKDNFDHFQGTYKDDHSCNEVYSRKEKKQVNNFPFGKYCIFMSCYFSSDGNYSIDLSWTKILGDSLIKEYNTFAGTYAVDNLGNIKLNGNHPFVNNEVTIKENYQGKKGKKYITYRGFKYRFNDQFKWINNKEKSTYCDGCRFTPDE